MKKVTSPRFNAKSGRQYLNEVRSIVGFDELWVAVRTTQQVQEISFDGIVGYQLVDGTVLTLQDHSWNDMVYLGHQTKSVADYDNHEEWVDSLGKMIAPNFNTPAIDQIRIGNFEDVYKVGYLLLPLEAHKDFSNRPILIAKHRQKGGRS